MPTPGRPPGVYDRTPNEAVEAAQLAAQMNSTFARFGYQSIETPTIEYADLFLTKSGDEAINRLFTFELYGRQLCLRSEFTASAARLYVERYQHEPKPIRWQVYGPVFRYESPGRGHSRQFTSIGAELIGAAGSAGDSEALGMAAAGLRVAGLKGWQIVIGHIGLVAALLERFKLDRRTRRLILGQIENLRRRGRAYVEEQYESMIALTESGATAARRLSSETYSSEQLANALELLLESANLGTTGTGRSNEDVARRLLTKQQRAEQRDEVRAALDFLEQLTSIRGKPAEALPKLEALLNDNPIVRSLFQQFKSTLDLLAEYGVDESQLDIQMGLARGVNYYTGIVFEFYSRDGDQLGGGGRYDDFIRIIGGSQETPAVGFMFNLERLLEAARADGFQKTADVPDILVIPIDETDTGYAAKIANKLRERLTVELYPPPTKSITAANNYATRRGVPLVIIVGERERAAETFTVRDLRDNQQTTRPLTELDKVQP